MKNFEDHNVIEDDIPQVRPSVERRVPSPADKHASGMRNTLKVYSDDHYMRVASTSLENGLKKMQNKLDRLAVWAKKMYLPFTTTKGKSYFTVRCPRGLEIDRSRLKLRLDGVELDYNPTPKLLGLYLDEQLNFQKTHELAVKKVYKKLAVVKRMLHISERGRF